MFVWVCCFVFWVIYIVCWVFCLVICFFFIVLVNLGEKVKFIILVFRIMMLYFFRWELRVLLKFFFNLFCLVMVFFIVCCVVVILKDFWVWGVIILVIIFCNVFWVWWMVMILVGLRWKLMVKLVDKFCKFLVEFWVGILNFCIVIL